MSSLIPKQQKFYKSAFGETLVAENDAIVQISAEYGIVPNVLTAASGGTATAANGMFDVQSGTGANNVATVVSRREANQRAGQGLSCHVSGIFTTGVADSTQQIGMLTSESAFCFGYNGTEFGVLRAYDGALEIQELTITTPAVGAETATVVVDGTGYGVNLTGIGTVIGDAYEIATQMTALGLPFRFTSNNGVVTCIGNVPDVGSGLFAYTSSTSVGGWSQVSNAAFPTEEWTAISNWSEEPNFSIDPTKLNDFKIQIQGNINFYIKSQDDGEYKLVHIIKYINANTTPSVANPTFRVGWAVRNTGNTTNLTIKGIYGALFNEGHIIYNQLPTSDSNGAAAVGATRTNIIAFRNRNEFRGLPNRSEILPGTLSLETDAIKPVVFEVVAFPEVASGNVLDWQYLDENNSIMEVAKNPVAVTGGTVVSSFGPNFINIGDLVKYQPPGSYFAITARTLSGNADFLVAGTWTEDN